MFHEAGNHNVDGIPTRCGSLVGSDLVGVALADLGLPERTVLSHVIRRRVTPGTAVVMPGQPQYARWQSYSQ